MGSFSLWHWLIVLLFFVVPLGLGAIICRFSKPGRRMNRKNYFLRILALFIAGFICNLLQGMPMVIAYVALVLAGWTLVPYWAIARLNDMGAIGRYKALWTNVPIVGLFYQFYLMFPRSVAASDASR